MGESSGNGKPPDGKDKKVTNLTVRRSYLSYALAEVEQGLMKAPLPRELNKLPSWFRAASFRAVE